MNTALKLILENPENGSIQLKATERQPLRCKLNVLLPLVSEFMTQGLKNFLNLKGGSLLTARITI